MPAIVAVAIAFVVIVMIIVAAAIVVMAVAVIAAIVIAVVAVVAIVAVVAVTIVSSAAFAVMLDVDGVVPVVIDEIDRPAAGIVPVAMFTPVSCMARPDMQVNGFVINNHPIDDARLSINDSGARRVTDVNAAKETWLPDTDGDANVCRKRGRGIARKCD